MPYRESAKPFIEPDVDEIKPVALCVCGHPVEAHSWFNSEMVDCGALGYYNRTPLTRISNPSDEDRKRGYVQHQIEGVCRCGAKRGQVVVWQPPMPFETEIAEYVGPLIESTWQKEHRDSWQDSSAASSGAAGDRHGVGHPLHWARRLLHRLLR